MTTEFLYNAPHDAESAANSHEPTSPQALKKPSELRVAAPLHVPWPAHRNVPRRTGQRR